MFGSRDLFGELLQIAASRSEVFIGWLDSLYHGVEVALALLTRISVEVALALLTRIT